MKLTARSRLETYASLSLTQSDEETYDLERTVVGSVAAGVTADRCAQCCACDRAVVSVAVGDREASDMEMTYPSPSMTDPTDVIERAQAWLAAADERGINRTDRDGYLAVIEDLVAEVEFQRTALQGYRNRQIELTDLLRDIRSQGRITGDIAKRLIAALGGEGKDDAA